jgi:hypothetical protein
MTIIEKEMKREGGLNSVLREEREGGSCGGVEDAREGKLKNRRRAREGAKLYFTKN